MEFLNDRIGILLKYGKVLGSLTKRFFYVDNLGNLHYTEDETISKKFLQVKNFKDDYLISLIAPHAKKINLTDCSVSAIKQFLEDKFNLKGRSYFELFLKTRDYRTILIFSWNEENINFLRDYFLSLSNLNEINLLNDQFGKYDIEKNSSKNFDSDNNNKLNNSEFTMTTNKEKSTQKIFEFADFNSIDKDEKDSFSHDKDLKTDKLDISIEDDGENDVNKQEKLLQEDDLENKGNRFDNKNFSFKGITNLNMGEKSESNSKMNKNSSFLKEQDNNFLNKHRINKANLDFKADIDNLKNKLNADSNHNEEIKYMDDYGTLNSNNTENINNKIYQINEEEKKNIENLLNKLNGRFVNQIDWHKPTLKILKPSQNDAEYEEPWAPLENGSDFSGHVKNSMPNGFGKEYRKDGIFYTGEFKNGKWHGQGVITNVNLDTFPGEFVNGCICGI